MDSFVQQIAEALMPPDVGLRAYPDQRETVVKVMDIAPRIAAAIEAVHPRNDARHCGFTTVAECPICTRLTLVALRGAASPAAVLPQEPK